MISLTVLFDLHNHNYIHGNKTANLSPITIFNYNKLFIHVSIIAIKLVFNFNFGIEKNNEISAHFRQTHLRPGSHFFAQPQEFLQYYSTDRPLGIPGTFVHHPRPHVQVYISTCVVSPSKRPDTELAGLSAVMQPNLMVSQSPYFPFHFGQV